MLNKLCVVTAWLLPSLASAAVVIIPASKDAMIFGTSANADTNNASGRGPALFAGADGSLNKKRSLLQFDIAGSVPAGATITGATLALTLGQVAGSGGGTGGNSTLPSRTFSLHDLQQDWGEGSSGSPTSPSIGGTGQGYARVNGDSTWDYPFFNSNAATATLWAGGVHGGNFAGTDSASSTFTTFTVGGKYMWTSAVLAADVQHWLDNAATNFGWLLRADNGINGSGATVALESTSQSFLGFYSRDGAAANNDASLAPALSVMYTVLPEPAGLALAGVFGVTFRRRRLEVIR